MSYPILYAGDGKSKYFFSNSKIFVFAFSFFIVAVVFVLLGADADRS